MHIVLRETFPFLWWINYYVFQIQYQSKCLAYATKTNREKRARTCFQNVAHRWSQTRTFFLMSIIYITHSHTRTHITINVCLLCCIYMNASLVKSNSWTESICQAAYTHTQTHTRVCCVSIGVIELFCFWPQRKSLSILFVHLQMNAIPFFSGINLI